MNFTDIVISWYQKNKRDLPWRHTSDPYLIWLSEIILQQTRVEQGLPYYLKFAARFPNVSAFAAAPEEEILHMWQGLGYYSRGRNMHRTANMVMEDFGGEFPQAYDELLKLKGVGQYTAAAISSFSINEAKAVVDGNVYRLLARYFGIIEPIDTGRGQKVFTALANDLIDTDRPGISNQAMMEFGALVCRPSRPECPQCPLKQTCVALREKKIEEIPVKQGKSKQRNRYFHYFIIRRDNETLFNKRGPKDIWENLYEFPLIETSEPVVAEDISLLPEFTRTFGAEARALSIHGPIRHILSHQRLFATFYLLNCETQDLTAPASANWHWVNNHDIARIPKPQLLLNFIKKFPNFTEGN